MKDSANKKLVELGYTPLVDSQWACIERALGQKLYAWMGQFLALGVAAECWKEFRAALLAVSYPLGDRLSAAGVRIASEDLIRNMVGRADLVPLAQGVIQGRLQAADFAKQIGSGFRIKSNAPEGLSRIHHVYGSSVAVAFESAKNRVGTACLQVEAAQRGVSGFDWTRKIALQLSDQEVLGVVAVLRGWRSQFEVLNHGAERNKYLTLKRQESGPGWLISVRRGKEARVCPIPAFAAFRVVGLAIEVLQANAPQLDVKTLLEIAQGLAESA